MNIKKYGEYEYTVFMPTNGDKYRAVPEDVIEEILTGGWEIIHLSFDFQEYFIQCKRKHEPHQT